MTKDATCAHSFVAPSQHPRASRLAVDDDAGWTLCARCDAPRFRWADQGELRTWGRVEWHERIWPPAAAVVLQTGASADALIAITHHVPLDDHLARPWKARLTPALAAAIVDRIEEIEATWRAHLAPSLSDKAKRHTRELGWAEGRRDPDRRLGESCRLLAQPAPAAALAVARPGVDAAAMAKERRALHMGRIESLLREGAELGPEHVADLVAAARGEASSLATRIARAVATYLLARDFADTGESPGLVFHRGGGSLRLSIDALSVRFRVFDRSDPTRAPDRLDDIDEAIRCYENRLGQGGPSGPYR